MPAAAGTVVDAPAVEGARTPAAARPWWRSPVALIGAGVAVLVLAGVGIGIGLAGGGGGGGEETQVAGTVGGGGGGGQTGGSTSSGETGASPVGNPSDGVLAFSSQRDGDFDIYAMTLDGRERVQLTSGTADEARPRYSPDGSKIVYYDNRRRLELYLMDATTQTRSYGPRTRSELGEARRDRRRGRRRVGPTQITDTDTDDRYPTWSPDGSQRLRDRDGLGLRDRDNGR